MPRRVAFARSPGFRLEPCIRQRSSNLIDFSSLLADHLAGVDAHALSRSSSATGVTRQPMDRID